MAKCFETRHFSKLSNSESTYLLCLLCLCTNMVVEAKLVSSSFSRPSRARPLFSLFSDSWGVMVRDFSKVPLESTVSLYRKKHKQFPTWTHQTVPMHFAPGIISSFLSLRTQTLGSEWSWSICLPSRGQCLWFGPLREEEKRRKNTWTLLFWQSGDSICVKTFLRAAVPTTNLDFLDNFIALVIDLDFDWYSFSVKVELRKTRKSNHISSLYSDKWWSVSLSCLWGCMYFWSFGTVHLSPSMLLGELVCPTSWSFCRCQPWAPRPPDWAQTGFYVWQGEQCPCLGRRGEKHKVTVEEGETGEITAAGQIRKRDPLLFNFFIRVVFLLGKVSFYFKVNTASL